MKEEGTVDLREAFLELQNVMSSKLSAGRTVIPHTTTIGDASELNWIGWLKEYLPNRYSVDKAFILDSTGKLSEQIDLVIYDKQYSPFLFKHEGGLCIPAESVYAVFEIKQIINKAHIEYAGRKVASVRELLRTSVEIPHAGGTFEPRELIPILAGIMAVDVDWTPSFGSPFNASISSLQESERLDLGCAIQEGSFEVKYGPDKLDIDVSTKDEALIFFFLRLFSRLQRVGTVPAMDVSAYSKVLDNKSLH